MLANPTPAPVFSPVGMRDIASIQEAAMIEQEVRKGDAGHPTVMARAFHPANSIHCLR
jgi:hypothetical protein